MKNALNGEELLREIVCLLPEQNRTIKAAIDVLEDGEALASLGYGEIETVENAHAIAIACNKIKVSQMFGVNTGAMCGQGLIQEGGEFPCSVGCERQITEGPYSQVFAVVDIPLMGKIAVTTKEFHTLDLPEINGF